MKVYTIRVQYIGRELRKNPSYQLVGGEKKKKQKTMEVSGLEPLTSAMRRRVPLATISRHRAYTPPRTHRTARAMVSSLEGIEQTAVYSVPTSRPSPRERNSLMPCGFLWDGPSKTVGQKKPL